MAPVTMHYPIYLECSPDAWYCGVALGECGKFVESQSVVVGSLFRENAVGPESWGMRVKRQLPKGPVWYGRPMPRPSKSSPMIRIRVLAAWFLLIQLLLVPVVAQGSADLNDPDSTGVPEGASSETGSHTGDEVFGELDSTPPAIFSVGLSAGFPSYQTIALNASIQAQYVGLQLKGSWTAVGPYLGAQVRGYLPIPVPVPIFIGVGGGVYGDNFSYHAAVGAHVPLGKNLRFDVEGGIANVPLLAERSWAPHLAVGVSYAFPVDLSTPSHDVETSANSVAPSSQTAVAPGCTQPRDPDRSLVSTAVDATVRDWLRSAQATFGSVYTDLSYNYRISGTSVDGTQARATVAYSGSVTEILTGARHSANGTASATFAWTGCRWVNTGVEY